MNQRQGFFQVDTERLEAEANRPFDFQDKVVIGASLIALVCLGFILTL